MFYQPKKCKKATLRHLAGRTGPSDKKLYRPALDWLSLLYHRKIMLV